MDKSTPGHKIKDPAKARNNEKLSGSGGILSLLLKRLQAAIMTVAVLLLMAEGAGLCLELARVKTDGKWGYIDKNGQMVIPAQFYEGGSLAKVWLSCG